MGSSAGAGYRGARRAVQCSLALAGSSFVASIACLTRVGCVEWKLISKRLAPVSPSCVPKAALYQAKVLKDRKQQEENYSRDLHLSTDRAPLR